MKTLIIPIATLFLMSISLTIYCQTEHETQEQPYGDQFNSEVRDQNTERPPEIPSPDAWIKGALINESVTWQEIDYWYRNKLPLKKDQPDYYNQRSRAIMGMINFKKFLEEANYEELVFYAREIIEEENMIGNAKDMTDMLKRAVEINPEKEKEVAQLAKMAEAMFKDFFSEPIHYGADRQRMTLEKYMERYEESYVTISELQYDPLGNPKY